MVSFPTVAVLGAGQIGSAVCRIIKKLNINFPVYLWDKIHSSDFADSTVIQVALDLSTKSADEITKLLKFHKTTQVINALPFFLNEKIAQAARDADCDYIDFTEDDVMADKVQKIYSNSPERICVVKCGLAPGFVNYIGHALIKEIPAPHSLLISVGALPKNINYSSARDSYNLTWSVDGLVNEYIRNCQVRVNGREKQIRPLTGVETVRVFGNEFEAAHTSGGVGSLVRELPHVPNVAYKSLRYPGHFEFIKNIVGKHAGNFDKIKKEFLRIFPYTDNDFIVIYAEAKGKADGKFIRRTFAHYYEGVDGFTAIQSTTAGAGVAIFEMIVKGLIKPGIIDHSAINLRDFSTTDTFRNTFAESR